MKNIFCIFIVIHVMIENGRLFWKQHPKNNFDHKLQIIINSYWRLLKLNHKIIHSIYVYVFQQLGCTQNQQNTCLKLFSYS